ncbi:ATP-dependent DNA helicase RecG [Mycolicibacterium brumae]|uniref:ATP-dependent DNA helicase RecG n=1 Tax=Mycolicibacterium brumae TaxID=85968 RepID=A0A2G5PAE7_9MYCO|nr:ATP-dependent DNA helicase RecG [Mycolicibacterium brumae]MCV7194628.1 ATP-dependent DNA helicase RecG [Mycolicibacterium brumae]PIB74963.1 ATP-dependent DNA helicase RecG [Mycolicibacterium brumae]RWA17703.1 hypothetical protein MBRU_18610 [Mycolicibacterium brumae DSM 44177]UWW08067.1 ATP-dependent DNA helicase RecG [Mycolicibacterium brumae]
MAKLSDQLDFIVGAKAAAELDEHLGIRTVDDLLRHYPRKYIQGTTVIDDGHIPKEGEHVTFVDTVTGVTSRWTRGKPSREFIVATLGHHRPKLSATFFNARFLKQILLEGSLVMISGELGSFRGDLQLTHPEFLILKSPLGHAGKGSRSMVKVATAARDTEGVVGLEAFKRDSLPIYPATKKLQSWDIYLCVRQVLAMLDPVPDPLPDWIVARYGLMSEDEALRAIHLAEHPGERERALHRIRFDESVGLQWALARRRYGEQSESGPSAAVLSSGLRSDLVARLPFELTAGQRDVLEVISDDLARTRPMNRMLQGEVGSGKTIVALLAMAQMVDAGYQCALLAPTEVLAEQHARSMRNVLGSLAMAGQLGGAEHATRVTLLTGSMSAAQKREVRDEIASGEAGIVIGTHALLQDTVEFHKLGMVVVDEQHRFGVEQRDTLRAKAKEGITPHLLVMTATPIPRTIALTVYGDLETSTLRELPKGRQPISTSAVFFRDEGKRKWYDRVWDRIREEVAQGRQAYVVAPRIDDDDDAKHPDDGDTDAPADRQNVRKATAVTTLYEQLGIRELRGLRLGLMHGKLSAEEKDAAMSAFRDGEIDVLVCTTVVEVGVDVPNATAMAIVDADWFGISQLHQLRGRIGRGEHASVCMLLTELPSTSKAGVRLKAVADTLDGFALAELDLAERREGNVLGRDQSGRSVGLRLLSLLEHREIIETARLLCDEIAAEDPDLSNQPGMDQLAAHFIEDERMQYLEKS